MVTFIKQRPLKSRVFAKVCENMQKDHVTLLQHTEVVWLSRGKVLTMVFELRVELLLFSKDNNKASFSDFLEDTKWLLKLAYLVDVYQHLEHLEHQHTGPKRKHSNFHRRISCFQE
jgi:Ni,Fe-hydrogenase I cytochrome b subunit